AAAAPASSADRLRLERALEPDALGGVALAPMAFEPREDELFAHHDGVAAGKWRFGAGALPRAPGRGRPGPVRAPPAPAVSLAASGRRVDGVQAVDLGGTVDAPHADFPARVVSVDRGQATGVYWFQSRGRTTGSVLERTMADVAGRERRWALVSVLFEGPDAA